MHAAILVGNIVRRGVAISSKYPLDLRTAFLLTSSLFFTCNTLKLLYLEDELHFLLCQAQRAMPLRQACGIHADPAGHRQAAPSPVPVTPHSAPPAELLLKTRQAQPAAYTQPRRSHGAADRSLHNTRNKGLNKPRGVAEMAGTRTPRP